MEHKFYVGQKVRIKEGALVGGQKELIGNVFPIRNICSDGVDLVIPGDPELVMDYYYFDEVEPIKETENKTVYEIVGQRHGEEEILAEATELQNAMDLVVAANLGLSVPHNAVKYYGFYHRVKDAKNG